MKPTAKFRLLRSNSHFKGDPFITDSYGSYYKLQQWWAVWRADQETPEGEWRDIPVEVAGE